MTAVALIYTSGRNFAVTVVPTIGTYKPTRPTPLEQRIVTLLLRAKLPNKLRQADTFLELNLISSHDVILFDFSGHHYQVCGGSLAEPQG
jgi:hypothetical protein